MRRSCSDRRTRATTSCEVGPTGLLRTSSPSIDGARDLLDERPPELVDRAADRAAGRVLVTAAPELLRDGRDVDIALRPHADAIRISLITLEEDDRVDFLDA